MLITGDISLILLEAHMNEQQIAATSSPLADCASRAVRDLATKLRQPCDNSSDIVNQIGFAARALRAYQSEVNGQIPTDFLSQAVTQDTGEPSLDSSIEQLLVGAALVTAADQDDSCPADEHAVSHKLGDWLASACLRLRRRREPRAGR